MRASKQEPAEIDPSFDLTDEATSNLTLLSFRPRVIPVPA